MIAVQPIANFDAPHTVIEPRDLSVNLAVVQIANEARHLVGELKIRIKFSHADTSRWTEWPYSYPLTPPPAALQLAIQQARHRARQRRRERRRLRLLRLQFEPSTGAFAGG